jgi:endonuclease YncB( thermonuclease family)
MPQLPDTPYLYDAEVVKFVDGDSVWLRLTKTIKIDFGFKIIDTQVKETTQNFRLSGINAAELRRPTRQAGEAAKAELTNLLSQGLPIKVVTYKTGKYGRYLADIFIGEGPDYTHVNAEMLKSEFVVAYGEPVPAEWTDPDLG